MKLVAAISLLDDDVSSDAAKAPPAGKVVVDESSLSGTR
jgi:hypothetical protein